MEKMVFRCPKGTKKQFRFKKGTGIRLGGCADASGRFTEIKEVKKFLRRN